MDELEEDELGLVEGEGEVDGDGDVDGEEDGEVTGGRSGRCIC